MFFGTNSELERKNRLMNLFEYLKKNGIKNGLEVFYKYKIDKLLLNILSPFLRNKPLQDIIVIESHNDFDCNGGAFYEYLTENGYNKKYKIVWLIKHPEIVPKELPFNVYWVPLYKPSIRKNYYRWIAKWFTFDMDIQKKCRNDQVTIFFDHGAIALKNVVPFYKGIAEKVDYILSPSDSYAPVLCKQFSIQYPNKQMLNIGYPSDDIYFNEKSNEILKITNRKYKKTILWMPTFRAAKGSDRIDSSIEFPYGIPLVQNEKDLIYIQNILEAFNVLLVIKLHPYQNEKSYSRLRDFKSSNIVLLDANDIKIYGIDNYRLLNSADALISDYSSSVYSFLLKDRPAAFVLNDMNEYKLGFIVDNIDEYIYGDRIYSFEDFKAFIEKCVNNIDDFKDKRQALSNFIYQYHDGGACQRVVEFMKLEKP